MKRKLKEKGHCIMKDTIILIPTPETTQTKRYSPLRANVSLFLRRYGMAVFFIAVLFSGMIIGAFRISAGNAFFHDKLFEFLYNTVTYKSDVQPLKVFADSFVLSLVFAVLLICAAVSFLGVAGVPLIIFIRGILYGAVSGYLCVVFGLKGLAYYIAVLLPGGFISALALVYCSQYCMDFSLSVILSVFGKNKSILLKERLKELIMNCAYMNIVFIFASLTDTLLYYLIGKSFI